MSETTTATEVQVVSATRRRFTPEQKRAFLAEAGQPGRFVSEVTRAYDIAPSLLFKWKKAMEDAANKNLEEKQKSRRRKRGQGTQGPYSRPRTFSGKIGARDRDPRRSSRDNPGKKVDFARRLVRQEKWTVSAMADALGVSRLQLSKLS